MNKGYSQLAPLYDKLDFTGNNCPIFEQLLTKDIYYYRIA